VHRRVHQVGAQPEQHVRDPRHGEPSGRRKPSHDPRGPVAEVPRSNVRDVLLLRPFQASADTVTDTTVELRSIASQYAISNKVAQLHPALGSSREASPNVIIQDAKEGAKGGKKRHKQHHQETATMVVADGGINKQAGNSVVVCVAAITGSGKRQARPPTDHFEKLLEEICPNHSYPIKHKLRDCDMMKNFMASGSLAQVMEVNEIPDEGDTTPFPGQDAVMTIYDGCPCWGCTTCLTRV
jgi:NAD-dependent dihydropyrimidine dehydrogenase PreA subunit